MTRSLSVWKPVYIITAKAARTLMEIEAALGLSERMARVLLTKWVEAGWLSPTRHAASEPTN